MKNKILIIEDNPDMRESTAELLRLSGYETETAINGVEGLVHLRDNRPDLILCDIMMPMLDGYGVLRAVKNIPELVVVPFVFISARAEKAEFRQGMDLGADDYLVKPFSGDELLRVVHARLERSRLLRDASAMQPAGDLPELIRQTKDLLHAAMLSKHREIRRFRKKESIYMEGDSANHLCLVLSGKVKTYRANEWGKEYITGLYLDNDFFGYFSMLSDSSRNESAMALEDSEIAFLPKQEFQRLLSTNQSFLMQFITFVMNSLDEAEQRMLRLAYDSARSRVAEALLYLFRKYKAQNGDTIPLSRENLSTLAGISPESTSRNLSDFRDEGLIETYHGSVKICDVNKLEHLRC